MKDGLWGRRAGTNITQEQCYPPSDTMIPRSHRICISVIEHTSSLRECSRAANTVIYTCQLHGIHLFVTWQDFICLLRYVCAADTFEASMKVGPASRSPPSPTSQQLAASEAGSPQSMQSASNGTVYASADAARVGGGLYSHLLDAAITLATDPASVVASTGAQLLRVAGVELVESDLPPGKSSATAKALAPHPEIVSCVNAGRA